MNVVRGLRILYEMLVEIKNRYWFELMFCGTGLFAIFAAIPIASQYPLNASVNGYGLVSKTMSWLAYSILLFFVGWIAIIALVVIVVVVVVVLRSIYNNLFGNGTLRMIYNTAVARVDGVPAPIPQGMIGMVDGNDDVEILP